MNRDDEEWTAGSGAGQSVRVPGRFCLFLSHLGERL